MTQADRDRLVTLKKAKKKLITQREAAEELGMSTRQVKRLLYALKKRGDKAVLHGLRGKPSNRRIERRCRAEGGEDVVDAGVCRVRADAGGGVPGKEARDQGEQRDGAEVDDRAANCGGRRKRRSSKYTSGGRGGAGLESWCSGTPASTIGWKGGGRSCT